MLRPSLKAGPVSVLVRARLCRAAANPGPCLEIGCWSWTETEAGAEVTTVAGWWCTAAWRVGPGFPRSVESRIAKLQQMKEKDDDILERPGPYA